MTLTNPRGFSRIKSTGTKSLNVSAEGVQGRQVVYSLKPSNREAGGVCESEAMVYIELQTSQGNKVIVRQKKKGGGVEKQLQGLTRASF